MNGTNKIINKIISQISNMGAQKTGMALFAASLSCLVVAITLSSFNIRLNRDEVIPEQRTTWTLPSQSENFSQLSTLRLLAPKIGNITAEIVIEDRENIQVIDSYCHDLCNRFFDIGKLQSAVDGQQLTLNFNQVAKNSNSETITVRLPARDWHIACPPANSLECSEITNKHATPIQLDWMTYGDTKISGKFSRLNIWQLDNFSSHEHTIYSGGDVEKLAVYGEQVELGLFSPIGQVAIHSTHNGSLELYDFNLLKRIHWQPLTAADRAKLQQLRDQDTAATQAQEKTDDTNH